MVEPKIEVIRELIAIVEESGLAELTVESGKYAITVRTEPRPGATGAPATVVVAPPVGAVATAGAVTATETAVAGELPGTQVAIHSPMVGIFYRSPAPGAPPFIEVGSIVEIGQTIGIVEAMKVFNEVPSDVRGRVIAIPVQNEQLVQLTDPLVILERM